MPDRRPSMAVVAPEHMLGLVEQDCAALAVEQSSAHGNDAVAHGVPAPPGP